MSINDKSNADDMLPRMTAKPEPDAPRDCAHGSLARACRICELERDLAAANAKAERYREALENAELALKVVYAHASPALQPGIYGQIKDALVVVREALEDKK